MRVRSEAEEESDPEQDQERNQEPSAQLGAAQQTTFIVHERPSAATEFERMTSRNVNLMRPPVHRYEVAACAMTIA
jgi:hypothetical protein